MNRLPKQKCEIARYPMFKKTSATVVHSGLMGEIDRTDPESAA
jgi:hypothetical protein